MENFEKRAFSEDQVYIERVGNEVTVCKSKERPLVIELVGSDGNRYKFLAKVGF